MSKYYRILLLISLLFIAIILFFILDTSWSIIETYENPRQSLFISFGGPTDSYHTRVNQICDQAEDFKYFTKVIPYTEEDFDQEFLKQHGDFMEKNKRGYGFWLWKPYIIMRTLDKMNDGDFLVYADSGCLLNKHGIDRLSEYESMLDSNDFGMIIFETKHTELMYTKNALFEYMKSTDQDKKSSQYMATVVILKKTPYSVDFVKTWYNIASNHDLINDEIIGKNHDGFYDHRHDQSVYSLLVKKYNTNSNKKPIILDDETWHSPNWDIAGKKYPIWGMRIRDPEHFINRKEGR
jgi:hypothetical protein